jgi:hypothetical protein
VLVAVLVVGTAVLTACGSQPAGGAAAPAPVSEAAATSSAATTPDELRNALLPASAFGADATVVGLTVDQLGQLPGLGGLPAGTTVEPAVCGAALVMLPRSTDDLPALAARGHGRVSCARSRCSPTGRRWPGCGCRSTSCSAAVRT